MFACTRNVSEFVCSLACVAPLREMTVSTGVPADLVRGDVVVWQGLLGATVLVAIPIAFVFNLLLDRFVAGFTRGAVKG